MPAQKLRFAANVLFPARKRETAAKRPAFNIVCPHVSRFNSCGNFSHVAPRIQFVDFSTRAKEGATIFRKRLNQLKLCVGNRGDVAKGFQMCGANAGDHTILRFHQLAKFADVANMPRTPFQQ